MADVLNVEVFRQTIADNVLVGTYCALSYQVNFLPVDLTLLLTLLQGGRFSCSAPRIPAKKKSWQRHNENFGLNFEKVFIRIPDVPMQQICAHEAIRQLFFYHSDWICVQRYKYTEMEIFYEKVLG